MSSFFLTPTLFLDGIVEFFNHAVGLLTVNENKYSSEWQVKLNTAFCKAFGELLESYLTSNARIDFNFDLILM